MLCAYLELAACKFYTRAIASLTECTSPRCVAPGNSEPEPSSGGQGGGPTECCIGTG